jgi:hypothetical protein
MAAVKQRQAAMRHKGAVVAVIKKNNKLPSLKALTATALSLPGLFTPIAYAADDDEIDFQYSHYQEGKRDIYGEVVDFSTGARSYPKLPQNLNPIEVDSVHGSARVSLTDRVKFAFNYIQDTWSGATPIGTAPTLAVANVPRYGNQNQTGIITGASPYAYPTNGNTPLLMDKDHNFFGSAIFDPVTNSFTPGIRNNQLTHVLSYASPETRKQGDFKLSYHWDEAMLNIGGGISIENDYESRFGNLGGNFDFNQKRTTVNWGVSYTNSSTFARLDPDALGFYDSTAYDNSIGNAAYDPNTGQYSLVVSPQDSHVSSAHIDNKWTLDPSTLELSRTSILYGNRQDWGFNMGLSQILDKDSFLSFDLAYTRSTGYLGNPYKLVYAFEILPSPNIPGFYETSPNSRALLEVRPNERNQFNWHLSYNRYVESLDAALHFNYHFFHDDWGIQAHTFEGDWVQPLGAGWTVTPRIRYYSQSAADFYTTGIFASQYKYDDQGRLIMPRTFFSSDQRLSGFGTLSGGVTVAKQFSKGICLETGFEYYTHQGSLKIGGGGEQAFADYDYWVANAALKVKLDALNAPGSGHAGHDSHHHHSNAPAGVMFDHTLPKAGDFMVGYRFMRNEQAGDMLFGAHPASLDIVNTNACVGRECAVTPDFMAMSMHMLDLMYAPTDWLTLMLMPQWMDMEMAMTPNDNVQLSGGGHGGHGAIHEHQTGGIGDFGAYALFKAFDHPNHHLTISLGGTAPTGDVDIVQRKTSINTIYNLPMHYGMQLGSGTWDFKPALTYAGELDNFLWGAQANATIRLENKNKSGYALGDIFQGSVWGGYQWTNWLATTARGVYTSQGKIQGQFPTIYVDGYDENGNPAVLPYVNQHIGPFDFPGNYGGQFVDVGFGVNVTIPSGAFQGNTLKFEWLQPVHTDYNGYQLDRDYALNFTWSVGF